MARKAGIPAYSLHKRSGQAIVQVKLTPDAPKRTGLYLGPHGSDESRDNYARVIADLLAGRPVTPPDRVGAPQVVSTRFLTQVDGLVARFMQHAQGYYRKGDRVTSEVAGFRCATQYLLANHAELRADDFGVGDLKAIRQSMIDAGLTRGVVNQYVGRIVRIFRWGASEELLSPATWSALRTLAGLQAGRTTAPQPDPVLPVDDLIIDATLRALPEVVAAMVKLQRATGMRPNEVCSIRPCDVDRSGNVWQYVPHEHKTQHHGKRRVVLIGPRGQDILRPFLLRPAEQYCFQPKRHVPVPIERKRYRIDSYRQAIERACDEVFPPAGKLARHDGESMRGWVRRLQAAGLGPQLAVWQKQHRWSPNRLRHSFATKARSQYGLEAAQVLLGHSRADITEVYAERDVARGVAAIEQIG